MNYLTDGEMEAAFAAARELPEPPKRQPSFLVARPRTAGFYQRMQLKSIQREGARAAAKVSPVDRFNRIREHQQAAGRASAIVAIESGQLASNRATANHSRWHVKRNIRNSECTFCQSNK